MTITGIISALLVGLLIGALGRLVVPGKQRIPIWLTIVIGIVAAFVGSYLAGLFGYRNSGGGFPWLLLVIQVAVAAVGVVLAAGAYGRRHRGMLRR
ncbi:transglycosylase [Pseudonocardia halophobica]|uniref:Transglycosylase n=1 Tax=Pseudonocardia halophobica TaxID=29401 RepID=A0A9W6L301_9PSEU|nr:GlsB/YeaQ/YmgE family stress response membrane protein [Pseudonocardia halophobica]GLL11166.1 transglycosylase [Pseudonocardia halophobica]